MNALRAYWAIFAGITMHAAMSGTLCGLIQVFDPTFDPFSDRIILLVLSVQCGAFVGGTVAARISGHRQLLHAGVVGFIVFLSMLNLVFFLQRQKHPGWLMIIEVLLPIPMSLLAGMLAAVMSKNSGR